MEVYCCLSAYSHFFCDFSPRSFFSFSVEVSYFKNLNYRSVDLGGIDEKGTPGITKFKRGLNGQELTFKEGYINLRL